MRSDYGEIVIVLYSQKTRAIVEHGRTSSFILYRTSNVRSIDKI